MLKWSLSFVCNLLTVRQASSINKFEINLARLDYRLRCLFQLISYFLELYILTCLRSQYESCKSRSKLGKTVVSCNEFVCKLSRPYVKIQCHGCTVFHRQRIAGDMSVNCTPSPPLKVGKFKWNYTFSGGNFPISTVFCNSLSVPNVSQTCKLVNNTLIGPEGPYKLIFKN